MRARSNKIKVFGLPIVNAKKDVLVEAFEKQLPYQISSIHIPYCSSMQRTSGIAVITFTLKEDAKSAIEQINGEYMGMSYYCSDNRNWVSQVHMNLSAAYYGELTTKQLNLPAYFEEYPHRPEDLSRGIPDLGLQHLRSYRWFAEYENISDVILVSAHFHAQDDRTFVCAQDEKGNKYHLLTFYEKEHPDYGILDLHSTNSWTRVHYPPSPHNGEIETVHCKLWNTFTRTNAEFMTMTKLDPAKEKEKPADCINSSLFGGNAMHGLIREYKDSHRLHGRKDFFYADYSCVRFTHEPSLWSYNQVQFFAYNREKDRHYTIRIRHCGDRDGEIDDFINGDLTKVKRTFDTFHEKHGCVEIYHDEKLVQRYCVDEKSNLRKSQMLAREKKAREDEQRHEEERKAKEIQEKKTAADALYREKESARLKVITDKLEKERIEAENEARQAFNAKMEHLIKLKKEQEDIQRAEMRIWTEARRDHEKTIECMRNKQKEEQKRVEELKMKAIAAATREERKEQKKLNKQKKLEALERLRST